MVADWPNGHKPNKLSVTYKGPYSVIGLKPGSNSVYECKDPADEKIYQFPLARLRVYNMDADDEAAALIALDTDEDVLIDIVDHNMPTRRRPADWDFKVRWAGYPAEEDSWIPWREARKLAAMDAYALRHPELDLPL